MASLKDKIKSLETQHKLELSDLTKKNEELSYELGLLKRRSKFLEYENVRLRKENECKPFTPMIVEKPPRLIEIKPIIKIAPIIAKPPSKLIPTGVLED